ncbi:MAG: hypothetical protein ACLGI3_01185, partial [Actinomycetes bacterium]
AGETRALLQPLALDDGSGSLALPGRLTFPPTVEVRIRREGQGQPMFAGLQYDDRLTARLDDQLEPSGDRIEVADPRGLLDAVDGEELEWTVRLLVAQYGVPAESLRPTLLAGGPAGPGSRTSALLVGITFPSGATTVSLSTQWGFDEQAMTTTTTTADPAPAGTALLDRVIAVATSNVVVVSGPSTGVAAQVYGVDGALVTTVPLVDGAGVGSITSPAPNSVPRLSTVRVLDGQGAVLAESPVEQEW